MEPGLANQCDIPKFVPMITPGAGFSISRAHHLGTDKSVQQPQVARKVIMKPGHQTGHALRRRVGRDQMGGPATRALGACPGF